MQHQGEVKHLPPCVVRHVTTRLLAIRRWTLMLHRIDGLRYSMASSAAMATHAAADSNLKTAAKAGLKRRSLRAGVNAWCSSSG